MWWCADADTCYFRAGACEIYVSNAMLSGITHSPVWYYIFHV